ncbi:amidase family protein [Cupriavidus basilensis]
MFDVAGYSHRRGNPHVLAMSGIKTATAPTVQRLLDAGAAFVGKTHTDELAFSMNGKNAHYGAPINGAAPGRITGGSSSGSASAVSNGLLRLRARHRHRRLGARPGQPPRVVRHPPHARTHLRSRAMPFGALSLTVSAPPCGFRFARYRHLCARGRSALLGGRCKAAARQPAPKAARRRPRNRGMPTPARWTRCCQVVGGIEAAFGKATPVLRSRIARWKISGGPSATCKAGKLSANRRRHDRRNSTALCSSAPDVAARFAFSERHGRAMSKHPAPSALRASSAHLAALHFRETRRHPDPADHAGHRACVATVRTPPARNWRPIATGALRPDPLPTHPQAPLSSFPHLSLPLASQRWRTARHLAVMGPIGSGDH